MISIQLLGGVTIRCNGAPLTGPPAQRHRTALLALVAASWPHALSRERAVALLWPESDSGSARRLLNLAVHVLRRALGEEVLASVGDSLLFEPAAAFCDVHAFRVAATAGEHAVAAHAYGGSFLDGFFLNGSPEFDYWLDETRRQLSHAYAGTLLGLAAQQLSSGDAHGRVGTCRRLAALDPYSAAYATELMRALAAAGYRAEAVQHAAAHARRVRDDLELEPDPAVAALAVELQKTGPLQVDVAEKPADAARHALVAVLDDAADAAPREAAELRDLLIGRLLREPGVRVAAPAVSSAGVHVAARRADAIVDTALRDEGGTLRLQVRMIDPAHGVFMLSQQFRAKGHDIGALAAEAAAAISAALADPRPHHMVSSTGDIEEAEVLCARGQFLCAKREQSSLRKAIEYFERARSIAPTWAPAYTGIASAYAIMGFYDLLAPREAFSFAKQAAETARALNPADPNCHASLGYIAKYFDWHWRSAERELQNAIHLDPQNALAHQWLGNYLVLRDRLPDAVTAMNRAVRLAPTSAIALAALGWAHYHAGEHGRAVDYCEAASELDPQLSMAHAWRGMTLEETGRHDEAIAALRRAVELMPGSAAFEAGLAHALAGAGAHDEARAIARRLAARRRTTYVPAYELAKVHLALGDRTKAMRLLGTAFADRSHSMGLLRVDPQLKALREDARFNELLAQVGHI
jgi:DNA-binding SARP family transcriptional activator/Tfp pilus assembly protein PilF